MINDADDFGRYGFDEDVMGGNYRFANGVLDATHVRRGLAAFKMAPGNLCKVLGEDKQGQGFSYALWMNVLPPQTGEMILAEWRDNNNMGQCGVCVMASGKVLAYRCKRNAFPGFSDPDLFYGESDRPVINTGGFNWIESYAFIDATDGAIEVRVNGVTVLNLSGINTIGAGDAGFPAPEPDTIAMVAHGALNDAVTGYPQTWMTDPIWWDMEGLYNNDFLGDKYVGSQLANGDTPTAQWIPSIAGPHYQMVDNVPPLDDAQHVTAWAAGKQDAYTLANLPSEVVAINAVLPFIRSEKTDAGEMKVKISALSGASQADGPEIPLTTSWRYYDIVCEVDPDTGVPWTVAGFNDSQILITRTV